MPSLRSFAQLRTLLPYAAKLLPVLTGVATSAQPTVLRPDLSSFNRHFGEIQSESRGLRTQVEDQGERLARIEEKVDVLAAHVERAARQQEESSTDFASLAALLKGLCFAIVFLLVAVTVMCVLILSHLAHA